MMKSSNKVYTRVSRWHRLACVFAIAVVHAIPVQGQTIYWGSSFMDNLFDSQGDPLTADFRFEIGTFGSSFVPDDTNLDQWLNNWKVLDRVTFGNGWNPAVGFWRSQ
jgi:hypothetical protein